MHCRSVEPRHLTHTAAALLAAGAAVSILATGCGAPRKSAGATTASQLTGTQAAGTASAFRLLAGNYERRVSRADIARTAAFRHEAGPDQQRPGPGPGRLIVTNSRITYIDPHATPPLQIEEDATATLGGGLTINGYVHPDQGSFCGPEIPQNATYTWSVHADVLTLRAVRDRCADRDSILTGAWKRT
jgi:hypothetical protein